MCIRHFVTILASCLILALAGGCTETMRRDLDNAAKGAAAGGKAARDSLNTPAGQLIPEPVKSGALAIAVLVETLGLAWLNRGKSAAQRERDEVRYDRDNAREELTFKEESIRDHRDALSAIVKSIEALPDVDQERVKALIAKRMVKDSNVNAIVQELKAA